MLLHHFLDLLLEVLILAHFVLEQPLERCRVMRRQIVDEVGDQVEVFVLELLLVELLLQLEHHSLAVTRLLLDLLDYVEQVRVSFVLVVASVGFHQRWRMAKAVDARVFRWYPLGLQRAGCVVD